MGDPLHELLMSPSACPDPVRPAALSAADLHACLQRLRQRSEEVKAKVRGLVTALSDADKSVDDVAPLAAEIPRLLERLLPGIALGNGGVCEELAVEDDKDSPAAGSRLASEVGLKPTATAGTTITGGVADIESSTSTSTTITTTSSSSSFADACFPPSVSARGGDISATARHARRVKRELREIEDSIETVEMVVGVHEVLTMIDKSLLRGEIVDAARAVVRLERAIIQAGVKREAGGKDDDDEEEEEEERVLENVGEEEVGLPVVLSEGRGEGALASGAPSATVAVIEQVAAEGGDGGQQQAKEREQRHSEKAEEEIRLFGILALASGAPSATVAVIEQVAAEGGDGGPQQAKEREERHSEKAEEEIRVFGILRSEFSLRKTKLKGILESLFRRALVIDRIHCELRWMPIVQLFRRHSGGNSGQITGTDLNDTDVDVGFGDILDALEIAGWLDLKLASLADTMFTRIFLSVIKDQRINLEVIYVDKDASAYSSEKTEMEEDKSGVEKVHQGQGREDSGRGNQKVGSKIVVLSWRATAEEGGGEEKVGELTLPEAFRKILVVVQFIREHIMGGKPVRMRQLGRTLWPRLAEAIIKGPLGKAVPNKTAELADFQKVADLTVGFEQSLVQEGLISFPDDAEETANESAPAEEKEKIASGESEGTTHGDGDAAGGRSSDTGAVGRASSSREVSAAAKAQVLLLSTFAADVDVHFAVKKRKRVVVKARDLLMNSDFAPVVVSSRTEIFLDRSLLEGYERLGKDGGRGSNGWKRESDAKGVERINDPPHPDPDSVLEAEVVQSEDVSSPGSKADFCDAKLEVDDEGRFFLLETCRVSIAAKQLVLIAHQAMEEACISTERTAMDLYHAGRDALLLYRAIVPVKHAAQLSRSALLGMLLYNDCLYIAHHLMTMGIQYRRSLLPSLRRKVVFVDLARSFQLMAEDACLQHIELQHSELMKALDQGQGFRYTDDPQHYRDASSALRQAVDILTRLAAIWKPILSKKAYLHIMGAVMDGAVARLVADVISLQDMAEEETVQLRALLSYFVKALPPLLELDSPGGTTAGEVMEDLQSKGPLSEALRRLARERAEGECDHGVGGVRVPPTLHGEGRGSLGHGSTGLLGVKEGSLTMDDALPSWKKLLKLIEVLALHLTQLAEAWERGELYSSGFTQAEVRNLVEAIFSETPQRKDCLMRILAKNFGQDSS
ncbi:hypothetical protein CBR_g30206 [Chara braunii]|uniref:Uncharacterized protein n=1 Tax=Chara braunii TaxID=69332 RepID=A0A388LCN0_CHABU|nr:hypothetical protein CBR_g30206 [Chara braunii]|eukprot:GBG79942.1 hypothetical protein CBR_g30206 [Chara braunii]